MPTEPQSEIDRSPLGAEQDVYYETDYFAYTHAQFCAIRRRKERARTDVLWSAVIFPRGA